MIKPCYYQGRSGQWADDVIDDFDLNFRLANIFKYIVRAGKKKGEDKEKDLTKAMTYLQMELDRTITWHDPVTP